MRYMGMLILVVLLLGSAAVGSQEKRKDFSGEWVLNLNKSDFGVDRNGQPRRPRGSEMVVEQDESELKVTTIRKNSSGKITKTKLKYSLDGEKSKNKTEFGKQESKVFWLEDGSVLEIESTMNIKRENREFMLEIVQAWSIKDGSLVIRSSRYTDMGEMSNVAVYDRKAPAGD